MYFLNVIILTSILKCATGVSLALVLDTTVSMQTEMEIIKSSIGSVINSAAEAGINRFVLVPFKDPDIGPINVTYSPEGVMDSINSLKLSGGRECPENTVAGIQKALEFVDLESYVFVFTDAYASDARSQDMVNRLCYRSRSLVFIFLSGYCVPTTTSDGGDKSVYYTITRSCFGVVIKIDSANYRQIFPFMKEMITRQYNDVTFVEPVSEEKQVQLPVNLITRQLLFVIHGDNSDFKVFKDGVPLDCTKILDTKQVQIHLLDNVEEYNYHMKASPSYAITVYRKSDIPYELGFSTKCPSNLRETASNAIPEWTNYILLKVLNENIKLTSVQLQSTTTKMLYFDRIGRDHFLTRGHIGNQPFHITLYGIVPTSKHNILFAPRTLQPQSTASVRYQTKPLGEIIRPESVQIELGHNATFACKIVGDPQPDIWWEDSDGVRLNSEVGILEIPSTFISYVTIDKATTNTTIYCNSKNDLGEDSKLMDIFVKRPLVFNVIKTPTDTDVPYENEAILYCEVDAYPEAEIIWYVNNTEIKDSENYVIDLNEGNLSVKRVTLNEVGKYKCQIRNDQNDKEFEASLSINDLETPQIEVNVTELVGILGTDTSVNCRIIKGIPTPEIKWSYKSKDQYEFGDLPNGVYDDNGFLKITSLAVEHRGSYKCTANNFMGEDSNTVAVTVQIPPKIVNDDIGNITILKGDTVEIKCQVEAMPAARVHWNVPLDHTYSTDEFNTLRFGALANDSGSYQCVAENDFGRDERTVVVNVMVPPYIETPDNSIIFTKNGSSVTLRCILRYGNPAPSTVWEFVALDSRKTTLSRGNSSIDLHLVNLNRSQSGSYYCIANNRVGTDSIKVDITVQ